MEAKVSWVKMCETRRGEGVVSQPLRRRRGKFNLHSQEFSGGASHPVWQDEVDGNGWKQHKKKSLDFCFKKLERR